MSIVIHELVLLIGPSASGKSTLMKKIKEDRSLGLFKEINITLKSTCFYEDFTSLEKLMTSGNGSIEQLVLHVDASLMALNNSFTKLTKILKVCDSIIALVLYTSQDALLKRIQLRILKTSHSNSINEKFFRMLKDRRTIYLKKTNIELIYTNILQYFYEMQIKSYYIVDTNSSNIKLLESLENFKLTYRTKLFDMFVYYVTILKIKYKYYKRVVK